MPRRVHSPPGAPTWSTAQFEALQRLRQVAPFWIDQRQIPNGELGGKPDDDVETLRWWPALMFSGDRQAIAAFGRMAEGAWFSRHLHRGYSRVPRDVEHSSEFVADTVPMMAFLTRSEEWIDRLAWSHGHRRDLWTGCNAHGDLQFKSAWIGATEIVSTPPRNRDLAMNARATYRSQSGNGRFSSVSSENQLQSSSQQWKCGQTWLCEINPST